jgi:5-hydroxyisourate hydrolase
MSLSTHVLDTTLGRPARGIAVRLEVADDVVQDASFRLIAERLTDDDGRVPDLARTLEPRTYRLTFATAAYFEACDQPVFYPSVCVVFRVQDAAAHHHVPLLLSPFGYATYRGS